MSERGNRIAGDAANASATASLTATVSAQAALITTLQGQAPIAKGITTLVAGVKAITITGIPAGAIILTNRVTPLGTLGVDLKCVITTNTLTITSVTAALATAILDVSVVHYVVWAQ